VNNASRENCVFHFTPQQIGFMLQSCPPQTHWQRVYHKFRKAFGLREEYADMIQLCRICLWLFWKSIGHPCIADHNPEFQDKLGNVDKSSLHVPIPPQDSLKFLPL
jgi:F-box protein 25/32